MDNDHRAHEFAHEVFWQGIKGQKELEDKVRQIMENDSCQIDPTFLGFLGTYYYLSKIIPETRTIYDMGCCFGFQSWFFRNHKQYIGVDSGIGKDSVFELPNTTYYKLSIQEFVENTLIIEPCFAICNYVPPWGADNENIVANKFKHVYIFYPQHADEDNILNKIALKGR